MSNEDLASIRTAAVEAARRAGELIREGLGAKRDALQLEHKGAVDLVTAVDLAAERVILDTLRERFPTHAILAEETGGIRQNEGPQWVIDPLDGTTNFAHSHPHLAVSLACLLDGKPAVGVVFDPARSELFTATRRQGAQLNDEPIAVSTQDRLESSLLATGFPYDRRDRSRYYVPLFESFMCASQGVRRMGSAALDLAWLACGRLDGFWEPGLKPWDIAAGVLMVREAGGRVTDYRNKPLDVMNPSRILASNGRIHEEMLCLLDRHRREWEA